MKRATAVAGIGLVAAFGVVGPASGFVGGSDEPRGGEVAVSTAVASPSSGSESGALLAGSAALFLAAGAGTVLVAQRRR